jgi:hypothetical protein
MIVVGLHSRITRGPLDGGSAQPPRGRPDLADGGGPADLGQATASSAA